MDGVVFNPYVAWIAAFPLLGAILNGFLLSWIGKLLPHQTRENLTSRGTVHLVAVLSVFFSFVVAVAAALYMWRGAAAWRPVVWAVTAGVHFGVVWLLLVGWKRAAERNVRWMGVLFLLLAVGAAASFAWTLLNGADWLAHWRGWPLVDAGPTTIVARLWDWLPLSNVAQGVPGLRDVVRSAELFVPASFSLDRLSAMMAVTVSGISFLIHVYSMGYMGHDKSFRRYFTYLNLFVFFMLVLVLADNLVLMFVGWKASGSAPTC